MRYEHIDDLVRRFRQGDTQAAEELIRMFQPILQRAFRFLRYGYVGGDEIFAGLCRVYGEGKVSEGARIIADRLKMFEDEELLAEVHYCFLLAAHSSSNLQYGFRRNVARRVGHLLSRKRRDVVYLDDVPRERIHTDHQMETTEWILGMTASEPFASLSQLEREILYRRIVMEEPFCSIAQALQMSEKELVATFHRLIKRLRESADKTSGGNNEVINEVS